MNVIVTEYASPTRLPSLKNNGTRVDPARGIIQHNQAAYGNNYIHPQPQQKYNQPYLTIKSK
ncbi:MAG: hypothetical protein QXP74_07885 [Nitrososphaerota archaeon]